MKTERGIYNNINESDYIYEFMGVNFYFSSMFYLNKFKENVTNYIYEERIKLYTRYKTLLFLEPLNLFLALSYYQKVEKRGKKVVDKSGYNYFSN